MRAGEFCPETNSPPRLRRGLQGGEYGGKRAGQTPNIPLLNTEGNRVNLS
jgi:hypothetical protein